MHVAKDNGILRDELEVIFAVCRLPLTSCITSLIVNRVCRKDHEAFSDYFESSVADEVNCRCLSRVCCFVPFVDSFINAIVTPFYLFSETYDLFIFTYDGSSLFIRS